MTFHSFSPPAGKEVEEQRTGAILCIILGMHSAGREKRYGEQKVVGAQSCMSYRVCVSLCRCLCVCVCVCVRDPCELRCPAGVCPYLTGGRNVLSMCTHLHTHVGTHTGCKILNNLHSLLVWLGEGEQWTKTWSVKDGEKV